MNPDLSPAAAELRVMLICKTLQRPGLAEALREQLPQCLIRATNDLSDAVFRLAGGDYHVALLDFDRFGVDGAELFGVVQRAAPHVRVLGFSNAVTRGAPVAAAGLPWLTLVSTVSLCDVLTQLRHTLPWPTQRERLSE